MSADLPRFERGETLRAEDLNTLAARVRELQRRVAGCNAPVHRPRVMLPGRRYAFQLFEREGVVYYRQGLLDIGNGQYVTVGEAEYNPVGVLRPCTIWLRMTPNEDGRSYTASLVQTEYDETTPEINEYRRLGYIRTESRVVGDGESATVWHLVQVCGGLMSPYTPRRMLSCDAKSDQGMRGDAGYISGSGYDTGERRYRNHITLKWHHDTYIYAVDALHGGEQLLQSMAFSNAFA